MRMSRRNWMIAAAYGVAGAATRAEEADAGWFRVQRFRGRLLLAAPDGSPFFSIGLNHIDDATLRYPENAGIWRDKYGGSMERWLREAVRKDLGAWGFNTVGWVQEVVTRTPSNHRHSRSFTPEEYGWLGLPYCHMLPFADFHQWEVETRHPDVFSRDFEEWCEYVARAQCARLAGDRNLIGYFYIDCPTWVHTREGNRWKGPLFDPAKFDSDAGRRELFDLASRYYKVAHDAIRRHDPHHLILGDRYEARAPLPEEVVRAAVPHVDVLSFQHFSSTDDIRRDLTRWHDMTGIPVLLADAARYRDRPDGTKGHDPAWYEATMAALREAPGCVGFHLCGAYLRNRCRQRGLLDEQERPDEDAIAGISRANRTTAEWARALAAPPERNPPS